MHLLVAEGAVDAAFEPMVAYYDVAAVQVIVEEAGGRFSDLHGLARSDGGSAVSSNGAACTTTCSTPWARDAPPAGLSRGRPDQL